MNLRSHIARLERKVGVATCPACSNEPTTRIVFVEIGEPEPELVATGSACGRCGRAQKVTTVFYHHIV
jgi:hypothetical protein